SSSQSISNDLRMMTQSYLTSPIGLLNIISVLINIAAILCVGIKWGEDGDVYMQLIFQDRGWQTAVLIFLVASITVTAALLLIRTFASKAKIESLKKITIVSLLIAVVFLCAFASAIEIWYVVRADSSKTGLTRVVICMILSLVLFIVNLLLAMLLLCNFDHYVKTEQTTPIVNPSHPPPPALHPPIIVPLPGPRQDPPIHTIHGPLPPFTKDSHHQMVLSSGSSTPVITLPPSPPQRRRRSEEND
ncbi:hypothetical protein PENTCL1PPCAC_27081, partial [Pristionchus entomophagus]